MSGIRERLENALLFGVLLATLHLVPVAGGGALTAQMPGDSLSTADRTRIEGLGALFVEGINAPEARRREIVDQVFASRVVAEAGEARLVSFLGRLRSDLGELDFHSAELAEIDMGQRISRILHVFARSEREDQWKDIQLRLEGEPPFRVQELGFLATVAEPVYLPNGSLTDPSTLDWLERWVATLEADEGLSGTVLVARGEEVLLETAFGFADAEGRRPVTPATRFNLGSGNKMFTAVTVARLVERGVLAWDTPLSQWVPEFPDPGRITLAHLLSHTSGVGDYWTEAFEAEWHRLDGPEDMLPFVLAAGTDFVPGTAWAYSNSNFVLAGLMAARASGRPWDVLMREEVFAPMGMDQTGFPTRDDRATDRAQPLARDSGGSGWAVADHPLRGSPAGGGYSTPRDMLRFVRGLVEGRLVAPETLETLTTSRTTGLETATDYGLGFILAREEGVSSFGHGGTAPGINFELRHYPSLDLTTVVFSNQDNGAYDDLRRNLERLATGAR